MKVIVNCIECLMLIFSDSKWRDKVGIYYGFLSLMKVTVNCIECLMQSFQTEKKWRALGIDFFLCQLHRMLHANLFRLKEKRD